MEERILIGYITRAFGINGAVSVKLLNPDSNTLQVNTMLNIKNTKSDKPVFRDLVIKNILPKNRIYFTQITTRTEAESLQGFEIYITKKNLPVLKTNEYYLAELINSKVLDNNNNLLGQIVDFSHNGAQDLLVIKKLDGTSSSIPLVPKLVPHIDIPNKKILVQLPDGLLDI